MTYPQNTHLPHLEYNGTSDVRMTYHMYDVRRTIVLRNFAHSTMHTTYQAQRDTLFTEINIQNAFFSIYSDTQKFECSHV